MRVRGIEAFREEAARFARSLAPHADHATVVTLSGDLGAGKTAFAKAVAAELGVTEHVTSPTFVIMKTYELRERPFRRLVHVDAYRLEGERHINVLGWAELLRDRDTLVIVEWPERVPSAIPGSAIRITLRYSGDDEREITYET
ncbi:MAG TPA: tRNA (adenosine(37)-N6)-threonylcarbamoyltransferase complex ATPase subunit type 1 TsaE [Candidatus Paceibacterota bacterium]|nr:tRNA (adenosine(37)-N6)-threonylcarbamoyltransferase complex ATPase subunit type 1 TsaE [Candidatus Paceibacterota bacterium]